MKCDNCKFKETHIGAGAPGDYSMEYCSKGHWSGGILGEVCEEDFWASCNDYTCKDHPKWVYYAAILSPHIKKIFTDDADVKIDLKELDDEENLQAFFHALSTVVPCDIFNRMVGDNKNYLEYNHLANLLCFGFMNLKKPDSDSHSV